MDAALERRWAELGPLLDTLLPLTATQRQTWLQQHCEDDDELRGLLRQLLHADAHAGDALEAGCAATRDSDDALDDAPPSAPQIAGYRVQRFLGAGGMASVFLAERELADTTQRVALKLLRLNVHDPQERRLFQREQAALARLEHPHIARLIDAGFAADGAPWLAVEYVEGESLLAWCDGRCLSPRARAVLFLDICAAVTAAHQALIVHRDLKPANVLVSAEGMVKLVDFGIAKLLETDAEATRTELRRLTPAYAAPEQFSGTDVGTSADVYALGVILTELMTGDRPQALRDGTVARLLTRRVDTARAAARGLDPASLRRLLRGDLEAIVARALRPDPRQRYASVEALGADVRAWLEFRPVSARRGTRRYRIGCFLRRNRFALALGSVVSVALLGATVVSLQQADRAERAAVQARDEAQRARRVQDFVFSMFRSDESGIPQGRATSAAELLERAARVARAEFSNQPESLVPLLTNLGELERGLGRTQQSVDDLTEAAEIGHRLLGPAHALTLQAEAELGHSQLRLGDYIGGEKRLLAALHAYRAQGGGDNEAVVAALSRLGMLAQQTDGYDVALARMREAVALGRRVYGGDHPALQRVVELYGGALADSGDLDGAARVLEDNLAIARRLYGDAHVVVASALESIAVIDTRRDQLARASTAIEEAERIITRVAPATHIMAAYVANSHGVVELERGRSESALAIFERALTIYHALYPADHPMAAATWGNLGRAARELDDAAAAARYYGEATQVSERVRPATDLRLAGFRCLYAAALIERGDNRADAILAKAIAAFEIHVETSASMLAECTSAAAESMLRRHDLPRAHQLAEQALAYQARQPSRDGTVALRAYSVLAHVALARNEPAAARTAVAAALREQARAYAPREAERAWQRLSDAAQALHDDDALTQTRTRGAQQRR